MAELDFHHAAFLLGLLLLNDFALERLVAFLQFGGAPGHELLQAFEVVLGLVEKVPFLGQGVGDLAHIHHIEGLLEHEKSVGVAEALDDVMPGEIGVAGADDDLQVGAFVPDVADGFDAVPARLHPHVHEGHRVRAVFRQGLVARGPAPPRRCRRNQSRSRETGRGKASASEASLPTPPDGNWLNSRESMLAKISWTHRSSSMIRIR